MPSMAVANAQKAQSSSPLRSARPKPCASGYLGAMTASSAANPAGSPQPPCASCGRDAEHDFGFMWLCTDCYHTSASTCAGVRLPAGTHDGASSERDTKSDDSELLC